MANPNQNRLRSNRQSNRSGTKGGIPFMTGGIKAFAPRDSLKGTWEPAHGVTAKGVKVNSLDLNSIGDSTLINNKGNVSSFLTDELEVASRLFLVKLGYTITAPDGSNIDGGHKA